jgi:dolichyl-phosphate-mannose-protein mannosyltransferase
MTRNSARWARLDLIALVSVLAVAAVIRMVNLTEPHQTVGDEGFYVRDACWYLSLSPSECGVEEEITEEHPPLGKWIIAAGIATFGYNELGWRILPALAGVLTVAVVYLLGRKLFNSTVVAIVASGLMAIDFLHFVQSRIAMLDVFVTLFGSASVLFAVYHLDSTHSVSLPPNRGVWGRHPWLLAAGLASGAAIATKWSGVFSLLAVVTILLWSEVVASRERGAAKPIRGAIESLAPSILLSLVAIPLATYVITFVGRIDGALVELPWAQGSWPRSFLGLHVEGMLQHHLDYDGNHPYASAAWSWPLIKRPVVYYFSDSSGFYREVMALGNPLVWWTSLAALAFTGIQAWRRRGSQNGESILMIGFACSYLPWLFLTITRSLTFIFYILPTVPFMCLALGYISERLWRWRTGRAAVGLFLAANVALFAFYYPLFVGGRLSPAAWKARIVIDDCALRDAPRSDQADRPLRRLAGPPPDGWCWI